MIPRLELPSRKRMLWRRWAPVSVDALLIAGCGVCLALMAAKMWRSGGDMADNIAYLIAAVGLVIAIVCSVLNMRYHHRRLILLQKAPMRARKFTIGRYCSNAAAVAAAVLLLTVHAGYSGSTFAGVGTRELATAGIDYILAKRPMAQINVIK